MLKTRETRVEERKEEKRSEKRDRILRAAEAIFLDKSCFGVGSAAEDGAGNF